MTGKLEKRASDAEREQVVLRLRDASPEGRLTFEELADRTALAYRATTHAELQPLTADLPATSSPTALVSGRGRRRWLVALLAPVHEGSSGDVPPHAPRVRIRGVSVCGPVFVQTSRR